LPSSELSEPSPLEEDDDDEGEEDAELSPLEELASEFESPTASICDRKVAGVPVLG